MIQGLNYSTLVVRDTAGKAMAGDVGATEKTEDKDRAGQGESKETPAVQREIAQLVARDREVRAHEQAHLAAAGGLAKGGGASFRYATGPDGRQYAVSGEVDIDTSRVSGDPEATISKARKIRAAAQAPANPSNQDRRVAAHATSMELDARAELARVEAQTRAALEQQQADDLRARNNQRQIDASYVAVAEG